MEKKFSFSEETISCIGLDIAWSIYKDMCELEEKSTMRRREFFELMEPYIPEMNAEVRQIMREKLTNVKLVFSCVDEVFGKEEDFEEDFDMDLSFLENVE